MFRKPEGMEWFVLIALLLKVILFTFVGILVYLLWNNRLDLLEFFTPDGLIVTPMDSHCPEESYMLKQMYYYDYETKKKTLMLVGSQEMVDSALKSMGDKKPMTHICNY